MKVKKLLEVKRGVYSKTMKELYFFQISDVLKDGRIFDKFIHLLSREKQQRLGRIRCDISRTLSFYSELIARHLICKKYNVKNENLVFSKNKYGKPYVTNIADCHFNISHTKNAVAVAISDTPVGIDTEKIKTADKKVAGSFFYKDEFDYIISSDDGGIDKRFFEVWTKKEAYIKYLGGSISMLKSFSVFSDVISNKISTYQLNKYVLSVCLDQKFTQENINVLSEERVIDLCLDL